MVAQPASTAFERRFPNQSPRNPAPLVGREADMLGYSIIYSELKGAGRNQSFRITFYCIVALCKDAGLCRLKRRLTQISSAFISVAIGVN